MPFAVATKKRILHAALALAVLAAVAVVSGGCAKKPAEKNTRKIVYDVARPEWITSSGLDDAPDELKGRRIDCVQKRGGAVWFGARDYGVASRDIRTGKWSLFPIKLDVELTPTGVVLIDDYIYVAASGVGIIRLDKNGGNRKTFRNPAGMYENHFLEIESHGKTLWTQTTGGIYTLDTRTGKFAEVLRSWTNGFVKSSEGFWTRNLETNPPTFMLFDAETAKPKKKWKAEKHFPAMWGLAVAGGTAAVPSTSGLFLLDSKRGSFKFIKRPEGLPSFLPIFIIRFDGGWLMETKSGLVFLKNNKWSFVDSASGLPAGVFSRMAVAGGNIFLGMENGPFVIDAKRWKQALFLADSATAKPPSAGAIGSADGDTRPWTRLTTRDGLPDNSICSILTFNDEAWIGSSALVLSRLSLDDFSIVNHFPPGSDPETPLQSEVTDLALDGDSIWHAGNIFYGRFSTRKKKWLEYHRLKNTPRNATMDALWVAPDRVWFGLRKVGLLVKERPSGRWTTYKGDYLRISPFVTDIVKTGDSLWLSMDYGLRRYDRERDNFTRVDTSVFDIESMAADWDTLWLGSRERSAPPGPFNRGLSLLNLRNNHTVIFNKVPGAPGEHVNDVAVDGPFVWVAAREGLAAHCRLTGKTEIHDEKSGLEAGSVLSVAVNADVLLVGTDSGLYSMRIMKFASEADRNTYRRAWKLENAGHGERAAEMYEKLLPRVSDWQADTLRWRIARINERLRKYDKAFALYSKLQEEYPLLLLEMESVYTMTHGLDRWTEETVRLMQSYKKDSRERLLCAAYLEYAADPLRKQARELERSGRLKNAARFHSMLDILASLPELSSTGEKQQSWNRKASTKGAPR